MVLSNGKKTKKFNQMNFTPSIIYVANDKNIYAKSNNGDA